MAQNLNAEAITYNLKPYNNWEVDIEDLERKVTPRTKLIVVVNPCNPCGSVFSKEHLLDILSWAEKHHVCVLADEVYHGMTFGKPHYPLGSLTDSVPVFTVGALSKMFLVPGWRCGWVLIYDKYNKCEKYRPAINKIKNMLLHPVPFIMQAIPRIFETIPENYFAEVMQKVKERADAVKNKLADVPALNTGSPEGSLYCMVAIDFTNMDVKSSVEFAQKLAQEEGVLIMPAEAFLSHSAFRIVLCHPIHVIEECMDRIKSFIQRHTV
jgi:tyrosine aminotransferase